MLAGHRSCSRRRSVAPLWLQEVFKNIKNIRRWSEQRFSALVGNRTAKPQFEKRKKPAGLVESRFSLPWCVSRDTFCLCVVWYQHFAGLDDICTSTSCAGTVAAEVLAFSKSRVGMFHFRAASLAVFEALQSFGWVFLRTWATPGRTRQIFSYFYSTSKTGKTESWWGSLNSKGSQKSKLGSLELRPLNFFHSLLLFFFFLFL